MINFKIKLFFKLFGIKYIQFKYLWHINYSPKFFLLANQFYSLELLPQFLQSSQIGSNFIFTTIIKFIWSIAQIFNIKYPWIIDISILLFLSSLLLFFIRHSCYTFLAMIIQRWRFIGFGIIIKSGILISVLSVITSNLYLLISFLLIILIYSWVSAGKIYKNHPLEYKPNQLTLKLLQKDNPAAILFIYSPYGNQPIGLTEETLYFAPSLRGDAPICLPAFCNQVK